MQSMVVAVMLVLMSFFILPVNEPMALFPMVCPKRLLFDLYPVFSSFTVFYLSLISSLDLLIKKYSLVLLTSLQVITSSAVFSYSCAIILANLFKNISTS